MKNTYISVIVLVVLAAGVWLVLGMGKKAEAPTPETSAMDNGQTNPTNEESGQTGTALITPAPVGTGALTSAPVKQFTITGNNFSFSPSTMTVNKGDTVQITFKNDSGFHDLKIDEFGVATKPAQGPNQDTVQFTADKTGSFQYYCSVGNHRAMGMWGTLLVQ